MRGSLQGAHVTLAFHTLDVFAKTPLSGNPLAVVMDADGLDSARMQAIAREFNLSETVFVLQPRNPVNSARIRIFTPANELPFAGHPTVGSAALIADLRAHDLIARGEISVVIEEEVGEVQCSVWRGRDGGLHARFVAPRNPEALGGLPPSSEDLAVALGLAAADIGFDNHRPSLWSAGVPFVFVPVRSLEAIGRARPVLDQWERLGPHSRKAYLYTQEVARAGSHVHARMFAPVSGIPEDPATGAAAAAFAGAAAFAEQPEDGEHSIFIEQGEEMGRPSLIALGMRIEGGALAETSISGSVVRLMDGTLRL